LDVSYFGYWKATEDARMKHWMAGIVFVSLTVAEQPPAAVDPASSTAPIDPLFDCYRANSAWGLAYSGKVVDRSGQVWSYGARDKALPVPFKVDSASYFLAADLVAKYEGRKQAARVDASALAANSALAEKAAAGKITTTDTGVRDAGSSTCHAYVFDAANQRYRNVELGSDGGVADQRVSNDAPEAQTLLDWLRKSGVASQ
jgi:hypothetical protein